MSDAEDQRRGRRRHVEIAERGKRRALAGDHAGALREYREAIRVAVGSGEPEVFFRHYLECSLESLEYLGAYPELLEYCDRAIEHYKNHPPAHRVALADLAHVHQRRAMVLLKQSVPELAAEALAEALRVAAAARVALPLAATVQDWLTRGWHVDPDRLLAEQHRHRYFSVRREALRGAPSRDRAAGNRRNAATTQEVDRHAR